jgi:hypothetical protein
MPAEVGHDTMSSSTHSGDAPGHEGAVAHHATDDHGDDHGHDDHGHAEEVLGPLDVQAWAAGVVGVALGVAMTACFVLATA